MERHTCSVLDASLRRYAPNRAFLSYSTNKIPDNWIRRVINHTYFAPIKFCDVQQRFFSRYQICETSSSMTLNFTDLRTKIYKKLRGILERKSSLRESRVNLL
ncbi:uncharacterized protein LOC108001078 [Apis cerana]|uniref:uncharacterized protein LOC108001078 n=1 Tax=Apis cerana TaxID=7461 RepID=UPI002B2374D8|nr:uncharacterized protein LOC108001078 [Apis cerana]